jgi:hypothetical protein
MDESRRKASVGDEGGDGGEWESERVAELGEVWASWGGRGRRIWRGGKRENGVEGCSECWRLERLRSCARLFRREREAGERDGGRFVIGRGCMLWDMSGFDEFDDVSPIGHGSNTWPSSRVRMNQHGWYLDHGGVVEWLRLTDISASQLFTDRSYDFVPDLLLQYLEMLGRQRMGVHVGVHSGEDVGWGR